MEYEISSEWKEVALQVSEIGNILRTDAISKSFSPEGEYKKHLNVLTGCYMYLVVEFKKWRALKENNEVAQFCMLKNATVEGGKFVVASGEKEASNAIAKERYFRDWLEGYVMSCEQGIYTLKKHLESDKKEQGFSAQQ